MTIGADKDLPTLWQHFMLAHDELPERHPVELFGEAVINRIFAGADYSHWRRFAPPALVGLAFCMGLLTWFAARAPSEMLLTNFSGAIALLAATGALYLWRDHRELSVIRLQFCAETEEQHRWLDRLDNYLGDLRSGTIPTLTLDPLTGTRRNVPASIFAGNNGRILLLDSRFDETRRAYRKPPRGSILVSAAGPDEANSPTSPAKSSPPSVGAAAPKCGTLAPAMATDISGMTAGSRVPPVKPRRPVHEVHHLHGLTLEEFEQLLEAYLAKKKRSEAWKEEFRALQRVTYELVQTDPCMDVGDIMQTLKKRMFDEHHQNLTFKNESITKMIGYSNTHGYSDFRNLVRGRTDPTAHN